MIAKKRPKPAKSPAAADPAENAHRLLSAIAVARSRAEGGLNAAAEKVRQAREQLAAAEADHEFAAAKVVELHAAMIGGGGDVERILDAKPYDAKLRALAEKCRQAPWTKLERAGATDDQIATLLKVGWPEYGSGGPTRARGGRWEEPAVWIDAAANGKPTLQGKALVAEVRRVMNVPQPTAAPKPAPKKKPAAKKPPAKKDKAGGGPPPAAALKPAAAPPPIEDDDGRLEDDDGGPADDEADAGPVESIEPGETYTRGQLGLKPDTDLEAHLPPVEVGGLRGTDRPDEQGGTIGRVVTLGDGYPWAVVGCSMETGRVVYALQPVCDPAEWKNPTDSWDARRAKHTDKAPEDVPLGGLTAIDPDGRPWVIFGDEDRVYCAVPREAAAAPGKVAAPVVRPDGVTYDVERVPVTTVEPRLGTLTLLVVRDGDGRYRCGHEFDLRPSGLATGRWEPAKGEPHDDRGAAVRAHLDESIKKSEASLPKLPAKKRVNARALLAAVKTYRDELDEQEAGGGEEDAGLVPPAGFRGEPAEALGVSADQAQAASVVLSLSGDRRNKSPVHVRPVSLGGRRWVEAGSCSQGGWSEHTLLPLYDPAAFRATFNAKYAVRKEKNLRVNATDVERREAYTGILVRAGKDELVIGPRGEARVLLCRPKTAPAVRPPEPHESVRTWNVGGRVRPTRDASRYGTIVAVALAGGAVVGVSVAWDVPPGEMAPAAEGWPVADLTRVYDDRRSGTPQDPAQASPLKDLLPAPAPRPGSTELAEVRPPAVVPHPAKPPGQKQTYGQWAASVRAAIDGAKARVQFLDSDDEVRGYYAAGFRPAKAAQLLRARQTGRELAAAAAAGKGNGVAPGPVPAALAAAYQQPAAGLPN